jgi:hypothetical protein
MQIILDTQHTDDKIQDVVGLLHVQHKEHLTDTWEKLHKYNKHKAAISEQDVNQIESLKKLRITTGNVHQ